MSKSKFIRFLESEPGWWHDPKWGVQKGRTFRRWALKCWRAEKGIGRRRKPAPHDPRAYDAYCARLRPGGRGL
jgi:hypothetical protein